MRAVAFAAHEQVSCAEEERQRGNRGVRGDQPRYNSVIAHNTVIVRVVESVKASLMARLVDEGARLLVQEGPAGISLRKVAAAAGVSTMPVYTIFGDKRGLLLAMHREAFR